MEKNDFIQLAIKVAVVLLALGFIFNLFYSGSGLPKFFGGTGSTGQNITGYALFNGTIRTYDPLLALPANTSQSVLDELRKMPGVSDIKTQGAYIIIDTETREDVYPLAAALRSRNIPALSVANIVLPPVITLDTGAEKVNVSTNNDLVRGIVRVQTEPLVDSDTVVTVSMLGIASGGDLIDYYDPKIAANRVTLPVNATVAALDHVTYTYSIPWESRNSVPAEILDMNGTQYKKVNAMVFTTPLSVGQIMEKKQFPYVVYIDANSAELAPDFDNMTQARINFQDVNVSFPSSTLRLIINGSQKPDLQFNGTASYSYLLQLPQAIGNYTLGGTSFLVEGAEERQLNSTVQTNVSILVVGSNVISVTPS